MGDSRTLYELRALITSDISRFASGMRAAANETAKLGKAWNTAARDVGAAALKVTGAVAGMATAIAVKFASFEKTMVRAGAVTRTLGTDDFKSLEAAARKMGEETVFSATQAAEAIEILGLAGFKTSEIVEALPGVLNLAVAGNVSIAESADVAAKAMRAFGLEAGELPRVNDALVATFTRVNTTISSLAEGLKPVAPVAAAFGVEIEEVIAVVGQLQDAGMEGTVAGNALRQTISRLAGAAPDAKEKLEKLGVTFKGSIVDSLRQIEDLHLDQEEVLNIFGVFAGPAVLSLLERGTDKVGAFVDQVKSMAGITTEIGDANLNTLSAAFDGLTSQVESFLIDAGKELRPVFVEAGKAMQQFFAENKPEIVATMTTLVRSLVEAFRELVVFLTENAGAAAEFVRAFVQVFGVVMRLVGAVPGLTTLLVALKVAGMLGLTTAARSLVAALLATVAAMAKLVAASVVGSLSKFTAGFAAASAGARATALAVAGLRLAILGGLVAAVAVLVAKFQEARAEMRAMEELGDRMAAKQREQDAAGVDPKLKGAERVAALKDQEKLLQERLGQSRGRTLTFQGQLNRAQTARDNLGWFKSAGMAASDAAGITGEDLAAPKRQIEAERKRGNEIAKALEDVRKQIAETEKTVAEEAAKKLEEGADKAGKKLGEGAEEAAAKFGEPPPVDEAKQALTDAFMEAFESGRDAGIDKKAPGASGIRDVLAAGKGAGFSKEALGQYLGQQKGATPEMAAKYAALAQAADGIDALEQVAIRFAREAADAQRTADAGASAVDRFNATLGQVQDQIPDKQLNAAVTAFAELQQKLNEGKIAAGIFDKDVAKLTDGLLQAANAAGNAAPAGPSAPTLPGGPNPLFGGGFGPWSARMPGLPDGVTFIGSALDAFGSKVTDAGDQFRDAVLEAVDPVQAIFDALQPGGFAFAGTSGFAPGVDPALAGGSPVNLTINTRQMSREDAAHAFDMIEAERKRRGRTA